MDTTRVKAVLATQLQQWAAVRTDAELADIVSRWDGRMAPGNALLIAMQRPDATDVDTWDGWRQRGRTVSHGEHAIRILVKGERKMLSADRMRQYINIENVFDIEQTHPSE